MESDDRGQVYIIKNGDNFLKEVKDVYLTQQGEKLQGPCSRVVFVQ